MGKPGNSPISPACVFLAFIVVFITYGSLFPFDFHSPPESFDNLLSRYNPFASAADAIDNLLLFVPLGLVLPACVRRSNKLPIASALAILTLGLGIQALQLYLPSRTGAIADVFWNGIGLSIGLFLASKANRWAGSRFIRFSTDSRFALALVLLWFFYETFPFVPTLDYGLLREHVKTAILAPPFEAMRFMQHLLAAVLCGIALQRARLFGHDGWSTTAAGIVAVLMEIFVAYGNLRRETLLGITIGLASGHVISRSGDKPVLVALVIAATSAYLITILTPYRGQVADAGFTFTPFSNFLWHNVTRDIPPLAYEALAIGSLLWAGVTQAGRFTHRPILWVFIVFLIIAVLEGIRVFALGVHGDTTTLLTTAMLGYFAATVRDRPSMTVEHPSPMANSVPSPGRRQHRPPLNFTKSIALSLSLLAIAIFVAARIPSMPYNIRELVPAGIGGGIAALWLATIIIMATNTPFLLLTAQSRRWLLLFPLLLPLQGLIVWTLLRMGIPMESIGDILGSPVLDWPWEWELLLRFLALHQATAMQMVGAVLLVATLNRPSLLAGFIYWFVISLLLSWPLHLFVIEWAATDNLTELMRNNAAFTSSCLLAASIWMLATAGAALSAAAVSASRRPFLLAVSVTAIVLAALAVHAGLEPMLVKYGKAFSALQFLLSTDRQHYLPDTELMPRFAMALFASILAIALLQAGSWKRFLEQSAR